MKKILIYKFFITILIVSFSNILVTSIHSFNSLKHFQYNNNLFLLAGHKVDFIAPCGANKSTFWPYSRKKIVCNTGKTFIFPSCTMYYFLHKRTKIFNLLILFVYNNFIFYPILLKISYYKEYLKSFWRLKAIII